MKVICIQGLLNNVMIRHIPVTSC